MRLLLDTSVLIDALRFRHGRHELLAQLVRDGHTLSTTAVNVAEVYAGMRSEEEQPTQALLASLDCYDITAYAGRAAGRLKNKWAKKGRTIAIADAIVAAIALERECTLMTDNRKDFPMEELDLYPL
ncbi:PIN domain protein [Candidatus Sulfotelmatobacter sp. SbA7]|jgi:predicted nucleic acid-binding protein|nr:PIN domain protein [Candidatus Sulfotelmatobacter sp. SbA7]